PFNSSPIANSRTPNQRFLTAYITLLKSSSKSTNVLFELANSALPQTSVSTVLAIPLITALHACLVACTSTHASNVGSSASQSAGSSPFIASESSSAISGNAFSYFANSLFQASSAASPLSCTLLRKSSYTASSTWNGSCVQL